MPQVRKSLGLTARMRWIIKHEHYSSLAVKAWRDTMPMPPRT